MVVGGALRASGCATCRLSLLRSFVSLGGSSIRIQQSATSSRSAFRRQQLRFSSQLLHDSANSTTINNDADGAALDKEAFHETENTQEETQLSTTPWYLQVDSPRRAIRPMSERQKIPNLPANPPPILEPLMGQVSVDLGLDDLTLLDLRNLDPPPALGANLLMLIGTTRSEKHLHVSADRFCRWLRTTYKLKPDADGLLGRNELKLKMKRKAKKAKLMGSSVDESGDDGVRTGWVCVDVGVVDEAAGSEEAPAPKGFVGFGRRTEGVRIVVQMLTEEKRAEIDLEKLWSGILERGTEPARDDIEGNEVEEVTQQLLVSIGSVQSSALLQGQTRGFHTSRRLNADSADRTAPLPEPIEPLLTSSSQQVDLNSPKKKKKKDEKIRASALQYLASGDYEQVKLDFSTYSQQLAHFQDDLWRPSLLAILKEHLAALPTYKALEMLGASDSDRTSTPFLRLFYETLSPIYVSPSEAETVIWLHCHAQELGHPGYESPRLLELFHEYQTAAVEISEASYKLLLRGLLTPPAGQSNFHGPPPWILQGATDILSCMHDQGLNILSEDMLVNLQELTIPDPVEDIPVSRILDSSEETLDFPSLPIAPITSRFHSLIMQLKLPPFKDESRMRLMDVYARRQHWKEFWDIFRMAPRSNQPQSASMFAFMFFHISQTKNQKGCGTALRTWYTDLMRESSSTPITGDLSDGMRACLLVAGGPQLEQDAHDPKKKGEWVDMWLSTGV